MTGRLVPTPRPVSTTRCVGSAGPTAIAGPPHLAVSRWADLGGPRGPRAQNFSGVSNANTHATRTHARTSAISWSSRCPPGRELQQVNIAEQQGKSRPLKNQSSAGNAGIGNAPSPQASPSRAYHTSSSRKWRCSAGPAFGGCTNSSTVNEPLVFLVCALIVARVSAPSWQRSDYAH